MRRLLSVTPMVVLLLLFCSVQSARSYLVQTGDTVRADFTLSSNQVPPFSSVQIELTFGPNMLDDGEGLSITIPDGPQTRIFTFTNDFGDAVFSIAHSLWDSFSARSGYVLINDAFGSFDIEAQVSGLQGGEFQNFNTTLSPVPIPAAVYLLGTGVIGIITLKRGPRRV